MSALERLSGEELLALARFIVRYASTSGSFHCRMRFTECARRGYFAALAKAGDAGTLESLCARHGSAIVCLLRTKDVLRAADSLPPSDAEGPVLGS